MARDFKSKKKSCFFSANNIEYIDFKDVGMLRRFLTDRGKILPRRITGVSAFYQRRLAKAVKRARTSGLLAAIIEGA
ncbi:MAG: 30S ribosomal protein S18 [Vampirovibrionales bacterium]|nr:30S ribosomal protein S18 [Vampirovibrionales bacterium]